MKKRDFFLDYVIQKEFIEDLMKAFGWVTLSSAIYTVSIWALSNDAVITGLLVFALFLAVSTLSLMYVCLYLFLPLNDSVYPDDPYWDEWVHNKKIRSLSTFTGTYTRRAASPLCPTCLRPKA